jgi:integrase
MRPFLVKLKGSAPFNSKTMSTLYRKAVKTTPIENLTFHDSRHEAITRLADKLDVLELARMVGHKNINQLMTYYNKTAEQLAAKLD